MNDSKVVEEPAQGADASQKAPDLKSIEKWLARDVDACIALLTAIKTDPDLRLMMARWFEGRILNYKNKPDPRQINMFGAPTPEA